MSKYFPTISSSWIIIFPFFKKAHQHTLIWTRKSLRCSLKAGISWFKLKSPVTNSLTWALTVNAGVSISKRKNPLESIKESQQTYSCRWGNADLRRLATYSWINIWLFTGFPGFNGVLIFPSSTKLNMYARIDACIVKPEQIKVIHLQSLFRTGCVTIFWHLRGLFSSTNSHICILTSRVWGVCYNWENMLKDITEVCLIETLGSSLFLCNIL